jgi:hypothetical protein
VTKIIKLIKKDKEKDEKDIGIRWKARGCVSVVYDDVELAYLDAKVAESFALVELATICFK